MTPTALGFLVAFGAGCLLAFVRHPIFGLLTYVGVFYVHPPSRWWGQGLLLDVRWALIAAGVTLLALLIRRPTISVVPLLRNGAFMTFVALIVWIAVQSFWAIDRQAHADLLEFYVKFALVIVMICRSVETAQHLRWLLWAHVLGCFYLGFLAYTAFGGGRLDGVGGPGIDEANAAALQMLTGIFVAGSLLLMNKWSLRFVLLAIVPFMLNGVITTVSRSAFLAGMIGGAVYMLFAPRNYRAVIGLLATLAVVLFLNLSHESYWERIGTIKHRGEEIVGVDTGGGRLEIMEAQLRMARSRPLGCGHMCTTVLSPSYLDARFLAAGESRASHNTFLTMLVDHGIPGAVFYIAMLVWAIRQLRELHKLSTSTDDVDRSMVLLLPAVAAVFASITIGDLFVQYPKLEVRVWFAAILLLMHQMIRPRNSQGSP
jgi:O-antigen ligase